MQYSIVWGSRSILRLTVIVATSVEHAIDKVHDEVCEDATILHVFDKKGEEMDWCRLPRNSIKSQQPCWVCGTPTSLNPYVDGDQALGYCGCEDPPSAFTGPVR